MAGALSGTMKSLIRRTAEHVSTRVQFGNKLETYGVVQEKIAHMALRQYVTEVLCALRQYVTEVLCALRQYVTEVLCAL
jgi:alkylation response protein AidB-like acyl-CoA dehydrogenase